MSEMTNEHGVKTESLVAPEDFARKTIIEMSPLLARHSLIENTSQTSLEISHALEAATTTEQVASVLGEAIILDDPNLTEGIRASMNLRDTYAEEAIFAGAVANAKAEMLQKRGLSVKAIARLKEFKDDVLYFFTDRASTPQATRTRSRLGEARSKFLKTGALVAGTLILAACGAQGLGIPVTGPTEAPSSEPVPVTETFTPESSTATPEASPTVEQEQHEPGTAFVSSEFNLDGQVETISENKQVVYDYFLDALMRVNPVEAAALTTPDGEAVFDPTSSVDENAARFRAYLEEHDWLSPSGWWINNLQNFRSETVLNRLDKPLNLQNLPIEVIDFALFSQMTTYPNITLDWSSLFGAGRGELSFDAAMGFGVINLGDSYQMKILIVDPHEQAGAGFPSAGEKMSQTDVDWLNRYIGFVLYTLRSFSTNPPVSLAQERGAGINRYFLLGKDFGGLNDIDDQGVGKKIVATPYFFSNFKNKEPQDAPPSILKLR